MRCRTAQKWISLHLDGRLGRPHASSLEEHLARCPACALAVARLERAWARLGLLPAAERAADRDFAAVLERVESRRRSWLASLESLLPPLPVRRVAALAVAASILAGSTAGVTIGRAAFGARRSASSPEAIVLSEGFGLLPFGSPASGLAGALAGKTEGRE